MTAKAPKSVNVLSVRIEMYIVNAATKKQAQSNAVPRVMVQTLICYSPSFVSTTTYTTRDVTADMIATATVSGSDTLEYARSADAVAPATKPVMAKPSHIKIAPRLMLKTTQLMCASLLQVDLLLFRPARSSESSNPL